MTLKTFYRKMKTCYRFTGKLGELGLSEEDLSGKIRYNEGENVRLREKGRKQQVQATQLRKISEPLRISGV